MKLGFNKLRDKIARTERREHPGYSEKRVEYIANAAAGKVAREKHLHNLAGNVHPNKVVNAPILKHLSKRRGLS